MPQPIRGHNHSCSFTLVLREHIAHKLATNGFNYMTLLWQRAERRNMVGKRLRGDSCRALSSPMSNRPLPLVPINESLAVSIVEKANELQCASNSERHWATCTKGLVTKTSLLRNSLSFLIFYSTILILQLSAAVQSARASPVHWLLS